MVSLIRVPAFLNLFSTADPLKKILNNMLTPSNTRNTNLKVFGTLLPSVDHQGFHDPQVSDP